jgi:hypothetical protein
MRLEAVKPPDEKQTIMDELAKRHEQLMQMRTAELNRLKLLVILRESVSRNTWNF